ncbi:OLC1v1027114C4 [Oldenlandia corymbosa var. corymbosa]|uniref:RING-type E3 ubiquitin transferase n=1 Tax=Oldenlandia corymbosa var. corymbosa TaxID=529605 RepID=A0AAV1CAI8_OLDCO|nr:OLC1v1027114C4 [Oldenlandia corymbosa var. corymbosa]
MRGGSEIVMEEENLSEAQILVDSSAVVVGIAISGTKKSKYVIRWALEKFVPEGDVFFRLIHVRPKISVVPTPMGNYIPIARVRPEVAAAFKKETEWETTKMLTPYQKLCAVHKVETEVVQIESDDVVNALTGEISKHNISKLVIGSSSRGLFSRGGNISSKIAESAPSFCTVYVVSKGKLSSVRPSDSESNLSAKDNHSDSRRTTSNLSSGNSSSPSEWTDQNTDQSSTASYSHRSSTTTTSLASLPLQRFQAISTLNQALSHRRFDSNDLIRQRILSVDDGAESFLSTSDVNDVYTAASSLRSLSLDEVSIADQASMSDFTDLSSASQINMDFELDKLRIELKHLRQMYAMAQSEAIDASRKLNDLNKRRMEDSIKLKETILQEEEAKKLAEWEKLQFEDAKREADYLKQCAEREAAQKREAEAKALHEAKEKVKLENALVGNAYQYQKFAWEEIKSATSSFSENLKIGTGAYGTVYKCSLHHTAAAVKILHAEDAYRTKQFQQELEILSRIRHPHLLILLGACPDRGCLVYEFMDNGNLEERLLRKNNSPALPWFERFRIAWEIASALAFLHNSKPKSIIHRDLKPSNILLDHNLVSKIGDVGLATIVQTDITSGSSSYLVTAPAGTFCYIDPEYQRTGLVSPKSDVYAFGMVILQLLTAKPPIGLSHLMENAIENDSLMAALDQDAGEWPIKPTKELAVLALACTELRGKDRPDLNEQILPVLKKLKEFAGRAQDSAPTTARVPPTIFICPILKVWMF